MGSVLSREANHEASLKDLLRKLQSKANDPEIQKALLEGRKRILQLRERLQKSGNAEIFDNVIQGIPVIGLISGAYHFVQSRKHEPNSAMARRELDLMKRAFLRCAGSTVTFLVFVVLAIFLGPLGIGCLMAIGGVCGLGGGLVEYFGKRCISDQEIRDSMMGVGGVVVNTVFGIVTGVLFALCPGLGADEVLAWVYRTLIALGSQETWTLARTSIAYMTELKTTEAKLAMTVAEMDALLAFDASADPEVLSIRLAEAQKQKALADVEWKQKEKLLMEKIAEMKRHTTVAVSP